MRGVDVGLAQFLVMLGVEPDGAHESQRLGDMVGQLLVARRLRAILDEAEHPAMGVLEIGVAAGRKSAQKVEGRRRLAVAHQLPPWIGLARFGRRVDVIDDVAAVGRQLHAIDGFGRRRARLGELPGDAADLDHRHRGAEGHDHGHLQEDAEEVADIIGGMLGEALGAIAPLQQEGLAGADLGQRLLQLARLAGEHQRRKSSDLFFDIGQGRLVRIDGNLQDRLGPPALGRPTFHHTQTPMAARGRRKIREGPVYTPALRKRQTKPAASAMAPRLTRQ